MICRVAIHDQTPGSIASDEARSFRAWIKEQPGFVGGYHAHDSQTLKSISITVWASKESMMALRDRTPPGGPVGITTDWQEIYDVVEEF
jgi:heme-degrading monooxygenase HmoA